MWHATSAAGGGGGAERSHNAVGKMSDGRVSVLGTPLILLVLARMQLENVAVRATADA